MSEPTWWDEDDWPEDGSPYLATVPEGVTLHVAAIYGAPPARGTTEEGE